jgi:hypothetical protein
MFLFWSVQEELVSLVAVLHDHAVDKAITSAIDSMDTNKDGIVTFGPRFSYCCDELEPIGCTSSKWIDCLIV